MLTLKGGDMKIKVLGCSGSEMPNLSPPAYLVDGRILLDAGTIASALNENAQAKIAHILITHSHLDHLRGITSLADNMLARNQEHKINIIATKEILNIIKENIFNNSIWPDFTNIPPKNPILRLRTIEIGREYKINSYKVKAENVTHSVSSVGYLIKGLDGKILLYTGDTGQTEDFWKMANIQSRAHAIDGLIIEVTFPNSMKDLAFTTKHLTPAMFFEELKKLKQPPKKIFITHLKSQFSDIITRELHDLKIKQITVLKEGKSYFI